MPGTDPTVPADCFARGDLDLQTDLLTQVCLLDLARSDHELAQRRNLWMTRIKKIRGQRFA